jgi:hypothetical protein
MQADILGRRPDNGQATGLRGEDVDLIGALPHIAEQTLNGIGRLNVSVHALRKRIKGQQVLFVLSQASYRFWIALRSRLGIALRTLCMDYGLHDVLVHATSSQSKQAMCIKMSFLTTDHRERGLTGSHLRGWLRTKVSCCCVVLLPMMLAVAL